MVSHAGSVLLLRTAEKAGLTSALSTALSRWRKPLSRHDPGKIVLDLAVSVELDSECLADLAQRRACPEAFGPVASDPTMSRLFTALAADVSAATTAIGSERGAARAQVWSPAGSRAPDHRIYQQDP